MSSALVHIPHDSNQAMINYLNPNQDLKKQSPESICKVDTTFHIIMLTIQQNRRHM